MDFRIKKTVVLIEIIIILLIFVLFIDLTKNNCHFNDKGKDPHDLYIEPNGPYTPEGIRLTAVNDSSNSIVLTWYTTNVASDPKVIYSTDPTFIDSVTVVPTTINIDSTYIYSANLKNLDSDTTYYYNVSSDSSNKREMLNFTTLPISNATSLKFLVFGDSRSQPEQRNQVAKKIMENFDDIDFSVHTGDIIEDGRIQNQWDTYFDDVEILTKKIPGYYIEGNHEQKSQNMYDNIPLPSNGLNSYYYNFSIGPINFIGLNTERDTSVQTTWLEKVFKKNHQDNDTLWQIAYMHQPIFNSRSDRSDRSDLIAAWCPLFEEYNLDLVFAGHNHYYERSYPMNSLKQFDDSSSYVFENPSNPMYLITGGAGAPLYVRDTNPIYAPFYNSTYHFIIVDINVDNIKEETTLSLETWAMPNDYSGIYLIDNITIFKKGALVNIHSPVNNQLFGKVAPSFNVTVEKIKLKPTWFTLNTTWYSIEDGDTNFTFSGETGTINQTIWFSLEDGTVKTIFYANDIIGNIGSNEILIRKDTTAPSITIISPKENENFGVNPPNFTVSITDQHLDNMWYSFNESDVNIIFTQNSTINQEEWERLPNDTFRLIFFANDSAGNVAFEAILIKKYISDPNDIDIHGNMSEFIGALISFITVLTIGGISYIYIQLKRRENS